MTRPSSSPYLLYLELGLWQTANGKDFIALFQQWLSSCHAFMNANLQSSRLIVAMWSFSLTCGSLQHLGSLVCLPQLSWLFFRLMLSLSSLSCMRACIASFAVVSYAFYFREADLVLLRGMPKTSFFFLCFYNLTMFHIFLHLYP